MSDVFISYSRRDKVFTQKLYEALKASGREIWADWDSIPAASDWFAEIKDGLEKADTIVFVLSPEWLKSNECRKEYDHAVLMGKRLLPILYQMVDPKDVPAELAKINWVYMRDTDDFDAAFQVLSDAMNTDIEWVKAHTRIQVRAIEWDKKNRDHSFLLRGNDLTDGEQFIAQGAQKVPEPTPLHGEYVIASRKDATRRQRMTLVGVSVALIVSVALGIVAFFQRQIAVAAQAEAVKERDRAVAAEATAEQERDRADLNAKVAVSRELAASSLNSLSVDPEQSLLLGLQSIATTNEAGQPVQSMSEDALRRAVQASRIRKTFVGTPGEAYYVDVNSDGTQIASAGMGKAVDVWDISGKRLLTLSGFSDEVDSVVFSPDDSKLLTASANTAILWDVATGNKLVEFNGHEDSVTEAIFSPDGRTVATASSDGTAKVWNAETGEELLTLTGHQTELSGVAFSPDGSRIATIDFDGYLYIWDAASGNSLLSRSSGVDYTLYDVEYSPDGRYLILANNNLETILLDAKTLQEVSHQNVHTDTVSHVSFSPDGRFVASASPDNTVVVVDVDTNKALFRLEDAGDVNSVEYTPDGKYLVTGDQQGEVKVWDANPVSGYDTIGLRPHTARIDGMEFSPDGEHYVTAAWDNKAFIWSLNDQSSIELVGHQGAIQDVAYSQDGKKIITGSFDGKVIIWDAQTGDPLLTLSKEDQWVTAVSFSNDGKLAVGGLEDSTVVVWDATSGDELKVLTSDQLYVYITEAKFSPDGKTLAVVSDAKYVVLWDVASWTQKAAFASHTDFIKGLAYSPDGTHIVTGSYDTTAIVWDAKTGEPLLTLSGHSQGINDVAYSPDGRLIATASVDGTAKLWDANTGQLLVTHQAPNDQVLSVAFSQDGKYLATGSEVGTVRFYYVNFDDVYSLAKERITRTFTVQECQNYLHEQACPVDVPQP